MRHRCLHAITLLALASADIMAATVMGPLSPRYGRGYWVSDLDRGA